jgi:hypothetical protein
MPEDWYGGVLGIAIGIAILAIREWFTAEIVAGPKVPWYRPTRAEPAMTHTIVVAVGLGFIAGGLAWLLGLPGFVVFVVALPATAIALLVTYLRER